jgi:hypothetical protein
LFSIKYIKNTNINNDIDISNIISLKIIWVLFLLVLIGVGLHLYDKIIIRGYEYFSDEVSIRMIRQEWIEAGKLREGSTYSSWQSALGYLLSFLYFPLSYLIIVGKYGLSIKEKYFILFFSTLGVSLVAYTIASRSTLLFLIIFISSLYVLLFIKKDYKNKLNLIFPVLLSFTVIITIICYDQIKSVKNFNQYASGYEDELYIKTEIKSINIETSKFKNILNLALIYANHGQNNFEYTIHQELHPGSILFKSLTGVLNN